MSITVRFIQKKGGQNEKMEYFIAMQRKTDIRVPMTPQAYEICNQRNSGTLADFLARVSTPDFVPLNAICMQRHYSSIRTADEAKQMILEMQRQTDAPPDDDPHGIMTLEANPPQINQLKAKRFMVRYIEPEEINIALVPASELPKLAVSYGKWTEESFTKDQQHFKAHPFFTTPDAKVCTLSAINPTTLGTLEILRSKTSSLSTKSTATMYNEHKLKTQICSELNRISAPQLKSPEWKYSAAKELAFLEHPSKEVLTNICQHLCSLGMDVQQGKNPVTGLPLLHVVRPEVSALKKMDALKAMPPTLQVNL